MECGMVKGPISKALKITNTKVHISDTKKRHALLLFVLDSIDAQMLPVTVLLYTKKLYV